ncbi:hypothetical protein BWZ22_10285 [Seonamhaeicola sp. S2-3]|nr:hypothetical protein BWZ22_10285 [Seonamhaeicola sp. S2-3]
MGVTRKGSGFTLQVLAPPTSGCGLFTAIPNASMKQTVYLIWVSAHKHFDIKNYMNKRCKVTKNEKEDSSYHSFVIHKCFVFFTKRKNS